MYERLLDKNNQPTINQIYDTIGDNGITLLQELEQFLSNNYDIISELKFPFGNNYGWGTKYSHKSKHLCYVFYEKEAFTVTIQIGKNELPKLLEKLPDMLPKTNDLWENRYPCGSGGWIHYRVLNKTELNDIKELIKIKKRPVEKK
ncbi:DUF3788 domain-containing protein [Vallitalea guaymasensis]|uniref:DUF3788 domain-containing protein n=1 Tax=Vallitalea guaymasensis TaxID=1185412 RepID=A0A8J8MCY5_9FIRM|nr:DUF3788 domain-containing protein [Vallitalea guaymasensis]QUH30597.1 DUF3788 domain-containing protein [Vallitalea guaymasensis]